MSTVRAFMEKHFLHFNSRETLAAARAYEQHLANGGKMLVALSGAMSTAKLGQILSRMIRAGESARDQLHRRQPRGGSSSTCSPTRSTRSSTTGARLSAQDEADLYERGFNRVTDTCIPERPSCATWSAGSSSAGSSRASAGERKFEAEFLQDLFRDGAMEQFYQIPAENSWLLAAWEAGIPVYSPGWEDSTTGNMFAAGVLRVPCRITSA